MANTLSIRAADTGHQDGAGAAALGGVTEALNGIAAGIAAARLTESLMAMSDAALAARGLRREDVPSHVFETVFARR